MSDSKQLIETKRLHDLMLQYKYLSVLKKLTKSITHEYNNLFTGLSGQMRIRKQEREGSDFSEKRTHLIEELLKRGIEQTEILFDISSDVQSSKKTNSPQRLAEKAIDLLNSVSRLHHFDLNSEDELPKIYAKHREIILMLFYLGENAIEAMAEGGKIRLEISHTKSKRDSQYVRFRMIDSGTGFSDEIKTKMLDQFFTTKERSNVSGLGLYAVQAIVKDHKGTLTIESAPGGGAVVTADIPVIRNAEIKETNKVRSSFIPHAKSNREKHVFLVIDDEKAMQNILFSLLQHRGHVVFCVESCKEAVEEFSLLSDTITVVLVDVGLKDATGYECARQLRMINENVCIILMSGTDVDQSKILDSRTAFINKPFSMEQIEQIVCNV